MNAEFPRVSAVERAISILEAFDASSPRLSLADLHRKTQIAKPTLLRLMQSLLDHGLLMPVDSGTYGMGAAALRLAGLHTAAGRMDNEVIAILNELAATTGETASYSVRQNEFRIYIHRVNSGYRLRDHVQPGDMAPLGVGATGKVLLAFSEARDGRLGAIRKQLFAVSSGEREPGMVGVSCPVFNHEGALAGAVSISGPASRLTTEWTGSCIDAVLDAARRMTVSFGGSAAVFEGALKLRSARGHGRKTGRAKPVKAAKGIARRAKVA
jgi:DNA-binding IclR family transcriptional regulator